MESSRSLGYPEEKLVLVHNGVDRDTFTALEAADSARRLELLQRELGLEDGQSVIVYVGSMSLLSHAVDLLLEAFAHVREHLPNARLLLAGGGEDIDKLRSLAGQLGIASHVHFVGRVPAEAVPLFYRLGTVSADPRLDTVVAESSLSLKLVESIAAGVPCVTSDIGDRRLMAGEAGIAVPPGDARALADGLLSILEEPEKASLMRQAALVLRDRYWWDVRVQDFASLYPASS